MKNSILNLLMTSLTLAGLTACTSSSTPEAGESIHIASAESIMNSELSATDKAEALAKAAEDLLTGEGFEEASDYVDQALKQDAGNLRAGFLRVGLNALFVQKGSQVRFQAIMAKFPWMQKNYLESLEITKKLAPTSRYHQLLLDGQPDLDSETKVQAYIDQVIKAMDDLRTFAKDHKDNELTMKVSPRLIPDINKRFAKACELKANDKGEFDLICPPSSVRRQVTFNRVDFENLQTQVSTQMMALALMNAYDYEGAIELLALNETKKSDQTLAKLTPNQIYEGLLKNLNFGKLRKSESLTKIKQVGLDVIASLYWTMDNQKTACKNSQDKDKNRVGFFYQEGSCFPLALESYVKKLENIFEGGFHENVASQNGEYYTYRFNEIAPIEKPVDDLRAFGPLKFDNCGQLIQVGDPYLAGLYPNGDANKVQPMNASKCEL